MKLFLNGAGAGIPKIFLNSVRSASSKTLVSLSFTYTAKGKRQVQVANFSK